VTAVLGENSERREVRGRGREAAKLALKRVTANAAKVIQKRESMP
jgi:hypothetical protein